MKTLISLILIITMAAVVTACVGKTDSPSNVQSGSTPNATSTPDASSGEELIFWSLLGGGDGEILESMIAEYNKTNPTYPVKHFVQDWGEYYNKLTFSVLSGEAPDVAISHATRLLQLADQKVIEPLDGINGNEQINWDNFVNNAREKVEVEGTPYAIPMDFHGYLLYYNTDLLSKAGVIASPEDTFNIGSFDDFTAALEKVAQLDVNKNTNKDDDVMPLGLQTDGDVPFKVWYNFYAQENGTPLLSNDGNSVTMDDTAATSAINALLSLYNKGYAGVYNNQWEDFKAGKCAFVVSFTSDVASFHSALGDNMNVTSFPKLFQNNKVFADSHSFVFPVSEKRSYEKEQAAMAFVDWMVNSGKWMQTGHFTTSKSVLASEEYNALPFVQNYKDSVNNLVFVSGSKNSWLMSPPKTLENFEMIYTSRESISGEDATRLIRKGLESDK